MNSMRIFAPFNFVPLRFWLYVGAALSLWFMVVRAAVELVL